MLFPVWISVGIRSCPQPIKASLLIKNARSSGRWLAALLEAKKSTRRPMAAAVYVKWLHACEMSIRDPILNQSNPFSLSSAAILNPKILIQLHSRPEFCRA